MKNKTFAYSFKSTLPVMAGYLVLGIGFGIILSANGYGVLWALGSSLFIYAGSMQFVMVGLLAQGASLLTVFLMTLLVNLRHIFYGISMLSKYKQTGKAKPYLIFALTDETFSLVCKPLLPDNIEQNKYYLFVSVLDHIWWITGSLIGSLLGQIIPFSLAGIDFAMTSLFVVMLVEQWESTKIHEPALIGIAASIICLTIFGPSKFLIPSMILITTFLLLRKDKIND